MIVLIRDAVQLAAISGFVWMVCSAAQLAA